MPEGADTLKFGYMKGLPENAAAAWGGRMIWPDDLLPDRQDFLHLDSDDGRRLQDWLNGEGAFAHWGSGHGALQQAREQARQLADGGMLQPSDNTEVVLFEDAFGVVKANPNGSYGYLYAVAYPKHRVVEVQLSDRATEME